MPIGDELVADHPGFKRIVVAGPNGDLTNAGDSPERAEALEVLFGVEEGWPVYIERWTLEPEEMEMIATGGGVEIELKLYLPQLCVHSMGVVEGQPT